MHILVAPNAFKNSLVAEDVAHALQTGIKKADPKTEVTVCPVGDGGDGTGQLLVRHLDAEKISVETVDALDRKITACIGFIDNEQTAIIELADASGLRLLKKNEYNPLHANTYGTGLLIKAALEKRAKKIILCIGGSATVDGGSGLLLALGVKFLDADKKEIKDLPEGLKNIAQIDLSNLDNRLSDTEIIILCDVKNKLLGTAGAAAVFGPQKGADAEQVVYLEECLQHLSNAMNDATGMDMSNLPHSGAAGGVAAALQAACNAKAKDGITTFLELIDFENYLKKADVVITGEGALDNQTLQGKAPYGVALAAKNKNKKVIGIAGQIPKEDENELRKVFDEIVCINPPDISLEEAIANTREHLVHKGEQIEKKLR